MERAVEYVRTLLRRSTASSPFNSTKGRELSDCAPRPSLIVPEDLPENMRDRLYRHWGGLSDLLRIRR